MNLKIGDIVRVVKERGSLRHWDKQGQVAGFNLNNKERPVKVWFGKECDYLLEWEQRLKLTGKHAISAPKEAECAVDVRTYDYAENELQQEPEWSMRTLVDRHFGDMCSRYYEPKKPFIVGLHSCEVKGCRKLAIQRIIFNIWGTADVAEVCDKHAKEFHLKCMDEFPHKKVLIVH